MQSPSNPSFSPRRAGADRALSPVHRNTFPDRFGYRRSPSPEHQSPGLTMAFSEIAERARSPLRDPEQRSENTHGNKDTRHFEWRRPSPPRAASPSIGHASPRALSPWAQNTSPRRAGSRTASPTLRV